MPAICLKNIKKKLFFKEFELAPLPLFIADFSVAKKFAEEINLNKEKTDYYGYITNNPEIFRMISEKISIINVNRAAIRLYEAKDKKEALTFLHKLLISHESLCFQEMLISILQNKQESHQFIATTKTLKGKEIEFIVRTTISDNDKNYSNILISVENIETIRNLTTERNIFYKSLETTSSGLSISDEKGDLLYFNPAVEKIYGHKFSTSKGIKDFFMTKIHEAYQMLGFKYNAYETFVKSFEESINNIEKGYWKGDVPSITANGDIVWVSLTVNAIRSQEGEIINYIVSHDDISERMKKETEIRLECYNALTELAEMRDNETGKHLTRVSLYSTILASELGMDRSFCDNIKTFAPLHDVGKVGISDEILLAPRKLSKEEFDFMKKHTDIGFNILKNRRTLEMAADIAYCHHEKFDGTGYPRGLKEEEIPYAARIVAIADVYDALRSKRPYKEPWEHEKVLNTIKESSGTHFDPAIVNAFEKNSEAFKKISIDLAD